MENTHSRWGDRRMEILWDCARAVCPGELRESLKGEILGSNTTEEAMEYLERAGIRRRTGMRRPPASSARSSPGRGEDCGWM